MPDESVVVSLKECLDTLRNELSAAQTSLSRVLELLSYLTWRQAEGYRLVEIDESRRQRPADGAATPSTTGTPENQKELTELEQEVVDLLSQQPDDQRFSRVNAILEVVKTHLATASSAARMLTAAPNTQVTADAAVTQPMISSAAPVEGMIAQPQPGDAVIDLTKMSLTSRGRMSELSRSIGLSDAQTLERCVATQHFVDAKLREGWAFSISKGRERHPISFPGQPPS